MTHYPEGPITPHGAYYHLNGRHPLVTLWAFDGSNSFSMMGGKSHPQRFDSPECVLIKKDGIKGLIAPWDTIDQKGASEDGVTFVDALQGPTEVELKVVVHGRDPKHCRKLARKLRDSIDKKRTSELSFIDRDTGRWWADVRWFKTPVDVEKIGESRVQELTLVLRADNGFWRTFPETDSFSFAYEDMTDTFTVDNRATQNLGDIPQHYTGTGGGFCTSYNGRMFWWDDPEDTTTTQSRKVINGPWPDFQTDTDNQVINQVHGGFQEWSLPDSARNIIGGRMGKDVDGNWDGSGVFVEYGGSYLRLFYTVDFVETTLRHTVLDNLAMAIPPVPGEKFTLVCGYEGDPRMFKVLRNGGTIMSVKESGTGSPLGTANRGIGNGMFAGAALITQATPSPIRKISAGDNSTVTQSGFVKLRNIGDQEMPIRYTVYGPGTFKFAVSPGSSEMIEFGPLLPNQVVYINTSRQNPKIKDLTSIAPTQQELNFFQQAFKDFVSWANANNVPPLLQQIESAFGIIPPQGNLYSLLKGRWNKDSPIPPRSPGTPDSQVAPYYVKVSIEGGNADSRIVAAGTPLRRHPL
ncbi:hypothetical protein A5761_14990 [Mycolicibacterium setense]|uniref:DUF7257 domain-containing protein n=1 Tax=Mycolicibacterium setense TaxID=431269 RepID=UPI0007EAED5F|nr:hypothetical protein [Mycolicibacterium setense]OBB15046.1 hypothetical protein A5761_14990 [Mycolicibacterium setense]